MFETDMETGWSPIPETTGLEGKLLSGDFDESNASGHRTRIVRFAKGGRTYAPYVHTYWEEVYLVSGEMTNTEDGTTVTAPAYVIRPPGTPHGPFLSENGCLLLEIQYFAERKVGVADHLDRNAPKG